MREKLRPLQAMQRAVFAPDRARLGQNWARAIAKARLTSAFAVVLFIGFCVVSAVPLGMIHDAPWLTVLVIASAAALAI